MLGGQSGFQYSPPLGSFCRKLFDSKALRHRRRAAIAISPYIVRVYVNSDFPQESPPLSWGTLRHPPLSYLGNHPLFNVDSTVLVPVPHHTPPAEGVYVVWPRSGVTVHHEQ